MTKEIKDKLKLWAAEYHTADFVENDPVRFPHRYSIKQDVEISGLLTAIMSFGNRLQILKKAEELHSLMGESPYKYVLSRRWNNDFDARNGNSYYRMLSYADFHSYFKLLHNAYSEYSSMEDVLQKYQGIPIERLCSFMGVSAKSPQKKLNMFLRWMIRKDSDVDLGVWNSFDSRELIIPLDTHVCRISYELGLASNQSYSLSNAKRITSALAEVFPDDPCLGDFALFGYGVNNK